MESPNHGRSEPDIPLWPHTDVGRCNEHPQIRESSAKAE